MARQTEPPLHDGDAPQTSFAQAPPRRTMVGRREMLTVAAAIGAAGVMLATPALAGPLALGVRFGNSPATVRVVVDLTGSRIPIGRIEPALDDVYATGTANFVVDIGGTGSRVSTAGGLGVRVALTRNHNRLTIRTSAASGRFKYVRWSTSGGPSRIVIDLWKAAPPTGAATVVNDRCLSLDAVSPSPGVVAVAGRQLRYIYENQFAANVRDARGALIGHVNVRSAPGRGWRVWVPYRVATSQTGTIEAVDTGGNGNLACLVQRTVRLTPTR